jgi:hypothetical protein
LAENYLFEIQRKIFYELKKQEDFDYRSWGFDFAYRLVKISNAFLTSYSMLKKHKMYF